MGKIDIRKTKRADFIKMCREILGTDEIIEFENATENFVNIALNTGVTVRLPLKHDKMFDIEVLCESDQFCSSWID